MKSEKSEKKGVAENVGIKPKSEIQNNNNITTSSENFSEKLKEEVG